MFAVLLILGFAYRLRLLLQALENLCPSHGTSWGSPSLLPAHLWADMLTAGALAALLLLLLGLTRLVPPPGRGERVAHLAGHVLALLFISAAALITQVHYSLLVITRSGLSFDLMREVASAGLPGTQGYLAAMGPGDLALLSAPPLLYLVFVRLPPVPLLWGRRGLATVVTAVLVLQLLPLGSPAPTEPEVRRNPVQHTASELLAGLLGGEDNVLPEAPPPLYAQLRPPRPGHRRRAKKVAPPVGETAQLASVRLIHPMFTTAAAPRKKKPPPSRIRWNVVMVIMESTGLRYPADRRFGKVPMPFLLQLSRRSLELANHYSTSNTSPHSIFSLFSGLYPMPRPRIYVFQKGLRYPTLFTLLPPSYQTLLVTPGSLTYYYPKEFMAHRGPRDAVGKEALPGKRTAPGTNLARHEADTVSFFLDRLDRFGARPFFAVYYSFAPHWPYPVYGAPYDLFPCERRRNRGAINQCRYFNNLHVLDMQLRRIHNHLQKRGLLDRTILLLVGDHGEAFGQHKKNWIHAHHSYNENLQVPAILYQPRLFKARRVTRATAHVDLFPTLLDAMGLPYNPLLVQGESLYQSAFSRRYIFTYGKENTLSSISRKGIKLQVSYRRGTCRAYDLARDPGELRRVSCTGFREQYRALRFFHRYQHTLLLKYNRACSMARPFGGQRHPSVRQQRKW